MSHNCHYFYHCNKFLQLYKIITTVEYSFKDVLEENTNYVSTVTSDKNINEDSDIISIVTKLYNGDKLNYNYGVKSDVTTKEIKYY